METTKMNIITKKIDSIMLDPANIRVHNEKNIEAIKGSLKKFGQQKPIVIDDKNIVIAGNGTLDAARQLGWSEINCVVSSLDKIDRIAFAIADNRTSDLSEFDNDALAKTLVALQKDADFDLTMTGFDIDEIKELLPFADSNNSDRGEGEAITPDDINFDETDNEARFSLPVDSELRKKFKDELMRRFNSIESSSTNEIELRKSVWNLIIDRLESESDEDIFSKFRSWQTI